MYKKSRIEKLNDLGILAGEEFNPSLKKDLIYTRKRILKTGVNTRPVNSAKQNVVKSQGNVGGGEFKGEEGGEEDFAEGEYDVDAEVVESNKKIKRLKEEKGFKKGFNIKRPEAVRIRDEKIKELKESGSSRKISKFLKSKVAAPAPEPAPAPEGPPESPSKRNERQRQERIKVLEAEQRNINNTLLQEQQDISIYKRALSFIGNKKGEHKEMSTDDKKTFNNIIKDLSGGSTSIGNLKYYDAAYKRIEHLSAETKKVMERLEEEKEAIEKEKKGPAPRAPPKSKARLSGLNKEDEIREEQAVKERVMKGVVSSVGGGGTKKKEDR